MNKLIIKGIEYNLDEWLTIKEYADRMDMENQQIHNRLRAGKFPKEDVLRIEKFNDFVLIKI